MDWIVTLLGFYTAFLIFLLIYSSKLEGENKELRRSLQREIDSESGLADEAKYLRTRFDTKNGDDIGDWEIRIRKVTR